MTSGSRMTPAEGRALLARLICQALRKHYPSERETLLFSVAQTVLQELRAGGIGCYRRRPAFDDPRRAIRLRRERR